MIREVKEFQCEPCGKVFEFLADPPLLCPHCGSMKSFIQIIKDAVMTEAYTIQNFMKRMGNLLIEASNQPIQEDLPTHIWHRFMAGDARPKPLFFELFIQITTRADIHRRFIDEIGAWARQVDPRYKRTRHIAKKEF
jgi:hypothetical protein